MSEYGVSDPRELLGRWSFSRTIEDRVAGDEKSADGTLTLAAEPAGACADAVERIRWSEDGTLHLAGPGGAMQRLPVTRTMFVVPRGRGWVVVFEDGHDFHPWTTDEPVVHPCGADVYSGRIDVPERGRAASGAAAPREWTIRWDVYGPAKDYTMITSLQR